MCSRYKRQLIQLNMKEKWPARPKSDDSRPIVAITYHATCCLTPAVFRLVPVRRKHLYWAIFDPAFPQCLLNQYIWHIRI